ncbi:MAG TPA: NlpC/P60 family protein [Streptosporangiaceae bacterium]|nr:NlpC/P60 family protein [Streptosporangiaceae bacterium]
MERFRTLPSRARRAGTTGKGRAARRLRGIWTSATALIGVATLASVLLPNAVGNAAARDPQPSLKSLVTQARLLSEQINTLSEQYDGLRIQLTQARAQAKTAAFTYKQDASRLSQGQAAVGQLAAQSYMNGGLGTPLQILTSSNASTLLSRAAIIQQIQRENGDRITQLSTAEAAARRARETALQQAKKVAGLASAMAVKKSAIERRVNTLNSAAFSQAMSIFNQTGQYPNIAIPTANTVGAEALRYALTRRGSPYVWGAAGPSAFDCSGLVMWAYQQVGISLPHYTGAQWNSGMHVSRSQLQPGDLVFFYPDIGHVGIYIGNGLMVDAPDFGQTVQVQPVMWNVYVGAVRIV